MDPLEELIADRDIRRLIGAYPKLADDCDGAGLARLFTEDGVLVLAGSRMGGRDAIAQRIATPTGRRTKHITVTTSVLIHSDVQASGSTDLAYLYENETGWHVGGTATYADRFAKTADGWRFAERIASAGPPARG